MQQAKAFVTEARFQAALGRISSQMKVQSTAIKTVDGRVRALNADLGRQAAALRKETADRKKDIDGVRKDLQSTREMAALIPLIAGGGTVTVPAGGGSNIPVTSSTIGTFAPLLLLMGPDLTGGSSGGSGSDGGMFGGGMGLIMLLVLSQAFKTS
jgi:hypothetical protein